jgi:hypothetical protein
MLKAKQSIEIFESENHYGARTKAFQQLFTGGVDRKEFCSNHIREGAENCKI